MAKSTRKKQEKQKAPKVGVGLVQDIMKAYITKSVRNKPKNIEHELSLPDGTNLFVLELSWRGYKRFLFETDSPEYKSFHITLMSDPNHKENLTPEQKSIVNFFLKNRD
jgi:hypothetical protein